MNTFYTSERHVLILLALLKAHGIRKVIASPGTTNIALVASMQQDPFFQMYSAADERSAAYMACGLATESGEPVILSCTGATASRNYLPGLTEAYYRKLPVLAITSTHPIYNISHHVPQMVDRSVVAKDVVSYSVYLPIAKDENVSGLIKNATKGLTGVTGATLKASGIAGTVHGLFDDGAIPFADQASAVYKKYTGIKEGKAKKDADDADAAEAMQKQANATAAATAAAISPELQKVNYGSSAQKDKDGNVTFDDMPSLIKQVLEAIKNINVYQPTMTVQEGDYLGGIPNPEYQRPGEVNTSAVTEQKSEVHGKVDANVSSEQLVNALNEVKNAINNTDKSISNRLGAMLVGIAAVQRSVQDNTRENKSSMEKVEKATQKVAEAVKDKGESAT